MGVGGGPMVPGGPMKGPGGMPDFGPPVPAGATAAAPPSLVPGTQGQPPRGPMDPMAAMAGLMPGSAGPGASGAGLGAVLAGTPQQQGTTQGPLSKCYFVRFQIVTLKLLYGSNFTYVHSVSFLRVPGYKGH